MFYSYTEETPKIFHIDFHQINAPNSCTISQLFSFAKERHGLCKIYSQKKKESIEKNGQVSE
jgi:tRNA A37 threonylcarbamoyladenosine biosynthesis protein TsaE